MTDLSALSAALDAGDVDRFDAAVTALRKRLAVTAARAFTERASALLAAVGDVALAADAAHTTDSQALAAALRAVAATGYNVGLSDEQIDDFADQVDRLRSAADQIDEYVGEVADAMLAADPPLPIPRHRGGRSTAGEYLTDIGATEHIGDLALYRTLTDSAKVSRSDRAPVLDTVTGKGPVTALPVTALAAALDRQWSGGA